MPRGRIILAVGALLMGAAPALAQSELGQSGNPVVVPPAPPIVAAPLTPPDLPAPPPPATPPPGLVQTPLPVAPLSAAPDADNGAPPPAADATAAAAPPAPVPDTSGSMPPVPPNAWVPGKTAKIGVLDKVNGSTADLVVPVGGQSTAGDLQISVLACVMRPPDEIPDAAIFVSVQPTGDQSGAPIYRGWMVRSEPGAAEIGDAGQSLRVADCS